MSDTREPRKTLKGVGQPAPVRQRIPTKWQLKPGGRRMTFGPQATGLGKWFLQTWLGRLLVRLFGR